MSSGFIIDDTIQNGATSAELLSMINERRSLLAVPEYYELITSNSITDVLSFYISSNTLTNVLFPYDTKALRTTALGSYTTTSALTTLLSGKEANLTFNTPLTRSTNTISLDLSSYDTISARNTALASYTNTTTTASTYISSNQLASQKYINSNSIDNIILYYMSSNLLNKQNYINSNSITDVLRYYVSSNIITNILGMYDSISGRNTALTSYTTTTAMNTLLSAKEAVLTFSAPLTRTTNTISLDLSTYDTIALRNTALASYLPLAGGTVSGNVDFGGTIAITGGNATYDGGNVDATNKINTYISFKGAGAGSDWCYLRQIGGNESIKLALDFCDDANDARFCIRNNKSVDNPDTITEVFTVDNGNVTATGTINGVTLQQNGVGVSTLITNALATIGSTYISSNQLQSQLYINSNSITNILGFYQTLSSGYLSSNQIASQNYLQTKLNGYVGIGTTPNYTLDAYGTNNFFGRCKIDGGGHDANKVDDFGIGRGDGSTKEFTGIKVCCTLGSTVGETYSNQTHINFWTWGNNIAGSREVARITSRGRLGIGSTLPAFEIDTVGSIRATNQVLAYAGSGNGYITMASGNSSVTGYLEFRNASGTRMGYIGNVSAGGYIQLQSESTCLGYSMNGKLTVSDTTTLSSTLNVSGNTSITASSSGGYGLTINTNRTASSTITYPLKIHSGNAVDSGGAPVLFGLGTEASTWAKCAMGHIRTGTYDQGDIVFLNRNTADSTTCDMTNERMRITPTGVTISGNLSNTGTTTLGSTLNVTGATTLSSTLTTTGNCDFGGTIAITGANANFNTSGVDAGNLTNTYISLKYAGTGSDWCYIRQIGGDNSYKLALDFCDDGDDARFCIRNNKSTDNPDTVTEVFTVNNGNISNTGTLTIAGATTLSSTLSVASTIIASGAITGQQYVNNYSTLYSTTVGGAYGIFYPVTRWLSNGSTFFVSYTIKIFTNGGNGSVETTGTFWGNSSSGIVGATASWSNGMAIASEPFYDSGTFYWRFFNSSLSLFGGYSYYKFIG